MRSARDARTRSVLGQVFVVLMADIGRDNGPEYSCSRQFTQRAQLSTHNLCPPGPLQ